MAPNDADPYAGANDGSEVLEHGSRATSVKNHLGAVEQETCQVRNPEDSRDPIAVLIKLDNKLSAQIGQITRAQVGRTQRTSQVFDVLSERAPTRLEQLMWIVQRDVVRLSVRLRSFDMEPVEAEKSVT